MLSVHYRTENEFDEIGKQEMRLTFW